MTEQDILNLIKNDQWLMKILKTAQSLGLPDWYIGAGFIRSKVWDTLHGYTTSTPLPDVDVIYFDKQDFVGSKATPITIKEAEVIHQKKLQSLMSKVNWSVKNQARMHILHHHKPYTSSKQALSYWVETATCVGVKIDQQGELVLCAPRGIDDLVNLILRPTSKSKTAMEGFNKRLSTKNWLTKWPKLKVII